jgi:hypothetical protein
VVAGTQRDPASKAPTVAHADLGVNPSDRSLASETRPVSRAIMDKQILSRSGGAGRGTGMIGL